ncbi:MAG TPA: TolC family protein [Ignavibacteria bacterium]|nr:TolC family protein [Ignavibacteria bacterium]
MKLFSYIFIMITLILFSVKESKSQQIITIDQAINTAIEQNLDLSSIQNNLTIQEEYIRRSKGSLLPGLTLNGRWTKNNTYSNGGIVFQNGVPISVPNESRWGDDFQIGLSSNVTLFDGFANHRLVDLDEQGLNTYRLQFEKQKSDIVINVNQAFYEVLKNEQIVLTNEQNLATSRAQLELVREYFNVGKRTLADIYRQDVQVAQDELALQRAINLLEKSKVDLLSLLNDDVNKEIDAESAGINVNLSEQDLQRIVAENSNLDLLVRKGIEDRYDYKGGLNQIELNKIRLDIANKNLYFPIVSGFASYNLNGQAIDDIANTRTASFGISLSYPIFQGFSKDVERQIAEVNIKQKELDLSKLELQIRTEIKKSILDLENAYNQVVILDRNIRSAEQDKLLSEENYRLGLGTLLDVQTATTRLNNLLIDKINATYNFLISKRLIDYYSGQIKY